MCCDCCRLSALLRDLPRHRVRARRRSEVAAEIAPTPVTAAPVTAAGVAELLGAAEVAAVVGEATTVGVVAAMAAGPLALLAALGAAALVWFGATRSTPTAEEAARLANYAGGLVVMKRGTATVSGEELKRAIRG